MSLTERQLVAFGSLAADQKNAMVGGPFGSNLISDDYKEAGIPVIRGQNLGHGRWVGGEFVFVSEAKAASLRSNWAMPGDIVFTQRGTLGQVAIVPPGPWEHYLISQSQMKATIDLSKADPTFIYYLFSSKAEQQYIIGNAVQAGVPHINLTQLRSHPISIPPLEEQSAIASILGALDNKIEQNQRTAQALERLARAIFRAWFVDFEPVKAKANGAISFPSMSPTLFDSLPTAFVSSERGPVPTAWETRPIATIATFLNGLALQKYPPRGDSTDLPVIKIAQLRQGGTSSADLANANIPAAYVIKNRDLLFSWSGTLDVKFWFGGKGALNQHLFKVTSQHYPDWFIFLSLQEHLPWFRMIAASKATTMGHIKREHLRGVHAVVAPPEMMREADALIAPLHGLRAHLLLESQRLANLRDLLLPRLLSGQVRVAVAATSHG